MKDIEELEKEAQRIITEYTAATTTDMVEIHLDDIPKMASELVKTIIKQPKPIYKAGDKVEIVANTSYHGLSIGETVVLHSYNQKDNDWIAFDGKRYWYVVESEFKPA
jgi:glutathione synthase/RimK-type ligase-like ATP-grasp enzyme